VARRSESEFDDMVRSCMPGLGAYAASVTSTKVLAEEAVQETLIRAWRYFPTFRGDSSPMTWLIAICRRVVIDLAGKERRHEQLPDDVVDASDRFAGVAELDLLHQLPLAQREIIVLCGLLGLAYEEAADTLGVPVGTVRSRLSRARETLAALAEQARAV
jgi:RNA polymerase sigma-70 factor (ECF subfamily)